MKNHELSESLMSSLYLLFEEKQNGEISIVNDILPIIKDEVLFKPITSITIDEINSTIESVLMSHYSCGAVFCAIPKFEFDSLTGMLNVVDIVYKALRRC